MIRIQRKGQSTLEYAILIIIIIAALVSLQTYIKRGVQGRLKSATDDVSEGFSMAKSSNYIHEVTTSSNTHETFSKGVSETKLLEPTVTTTATNILMNAEDENWFQVTK